MYCDTVTRVMSGFESGSKSFKITFLLVPSFNFDIPFTETESDQVNAHGKECQVVGHEFDVRGLGVNHAICLVNNRATHNYHKTWIV